MGPHGTSLSGSAVCEIHHAPGEEHEALEQLQQALDDAGADPPDAAGRAAEILRDAESVVVAFGSGLTRRLNGTANLDALSRLAEGLEARLLPLFSDANDHGAREIAASFDSDGLTAPEILRSAADGELDLLYLVGQDALPGSSEKTFVVVQDTFLSPGVAEIADVVLPAASFAEIDGSTTDMYGQVRMIRRAIQPLGTSKPDWEILSILAGKLGAEGFEYADASAVISELAKNVPFYRGASYASLEKGKPFFGKPRAADKGKAKKAASAKAAGRKPVSEKPDHDYPLVLVAELDEFAHRATPLSSQVPGLRRLERAPAVLLNPEDAGALGVGDDAPVSVISRRGRVDAKVQLSPGTREGVARMVVREGESSPAPLLQGLLDPTSKTPDELCAVRIEKL
jgi:predicted molibdopterin-dependent oxidoreductase YjgC